MKDTEGYILPPNKSSALPCKMLFYDCETDYHDDGRVQTHFFRLGWSCYLERSKTKGVTTEKWTYHEDEKTFLDLIDQRAYEGTTLYILGHNIAFDLTVSGFYREYTKRVWLLDFFYDAGLTHILSLKKGRRKIRILSTTNYYSFSLAALGKVLGIPKGEVDFLTATDEELKPYCRQDVEITKQAFLYWLDYVQENNLGKFGLTKSSQAFNAFRHRFMEKQIFIHRDPDTIDLERAAYMGGRTEAFFIGQAKGGPFVSLDINSMYPYIMKTFKLPSKLIQTGGGMSVERLSVMLGEYGMIAEVDVKVDKAAFAYHGETKILFPVGSFTTHLTTPGLKLALERGWIRKVKTWAAYEMDNLFSPYIDFFYDQKRIHTENKNEVFRQMSKYYMNTLYGKFGQKRKVEDRIDDPDPEGFSRELIFCLETGKVWTETRLFNVCLTTYHETNGKNTFVAIPAHITEYGRLILWEIMDQLGPEKVLYCDTDSIKIRKADLPLVKYPIDPLALGALSVEGSFLSLLIHGCKDYEADEDIKIKGIPRSGRLLGDAKYIYTQFEGFLSNLRENNMDTIKVKRAIKVLKREYDKGIVQGSGWVLPFTFPDPC